MDVKLINPFIESFLSVMPQIGFSDIKKGNLSLKDRNIKSDGVMINLGIVGDIKGNVIYSMTIDHAKAVASKMMMGMMVEELDDMAQSALSELSNMLTANASINFENMEINTNISTPTLLYGKDFNVQVNAEKVLCIEILADNIPIEVNIAFN
ncbi:MAG: chemotaxis protein CheX [Marinisporobacter sp.]|jgi:chemotaxis protein CheX|nr:chemotaxis protein CheX [Marinisporobacter sp.]